MSLYNTFEGGATNYGTQANFDNNYRLTTSTLLETYKTPFLSSNRIWINGYANFRNDVINFNTVLNSSSIQHTTAAEVSRTHAWTSGWVATAAAGLYANSIVTSTITNISSSSVSSSSITITWTTNLAASSKVDFSVTSTSYDSSTTESNTSTRVTSHSVNVSSLLPCTSFYYRVRSKTYILNETTSTAKAFLTSGCSGDAAVTSSSAATFTSSTGGSITLSTITLSVPAAFKSGVSSAEFQTKQLNGATFFSAITSPSGKSRVGNEVYNLKALSSSTSTISDFSSPLTITMTYSLSDISGLVESGLTIYRYDGSSWNALSGCSVDTTARTVTCTTIQFSDFALFGAAQAAAQSSGGTAIPYNVFSEKIIFVSATSTVTLPHPPKPVSTVVKDLKSALPSAIFKRPLYQGIASDDVRRLQKLLASKPQIYPEGRITGYFGVLTKKAVQRFQLQYHVINSTAQVGFGYVGPATRVKLKEVFGNNL